MPEISEIPARIAHVLPALRALRFYTATTRGFREREQVKLARFLKDVAERELQDFSPDQVKEWLKTKAGWVDTSDYRRGDTTPYLALLQAIPATLVERTRDYAMLIAAGSGRKPRDPNEVARIESEFSPAPHVIQPPPMTEEPVIGVVIDASRFFKSDG